MAYCRRMGLDPITRQVHFVIRRARNANGEWERRPIIQVGIHGLLAKAEESGQWDGLEPIEYHFQEKEDGTKELVAATARVWRKGISRPFPYTARYDEYAERDKDGNITRQWREKKFLMIAKCAIAGALRLAFPQKLGALYIPEEIPRQEVEDHIPTLEPPRMRELPPDFLGDEEERVEESEDRERVEELETLT